MRKVAYVAHCPGHKNSKGELAEWCVKSHETGKIISSHGTEAAAKKHLQDMHAHSGSKRAAYGVLESDYTHNLRSAIEAFEGLIEAYQDEVPDVNMAKQRSAVVFLKTLENEPAPEPDEDEQRDNWDREHGKQSTSKVAFVQHMPAHRDFMGKPKPWVIRDWRNGQILGEFETEEEAKRKFRRMRASVPSSLLLRKKAIPAAMAVNNAGGGVRPVEEGDEAHGYKCAVCGTENFVRVDGRLTCLTCHPQKTARQPMHDDSGATTGLRRRLDYGESDSFTSEMNDANSKSAAVIAIDSGIKVKNAAQKRTLYVTGVEFTPGSASKVARFNFSADRKKAMWFGKATVRTVNDQLNGPTFSVKARVENVG